MVSNRARQLSLFKDTNGSCRSTLPGSRDLFRLATLPVRALCTGCRAKEARYGFRDADLLEAPSTLCFECYWLQLEQRQRTASKDAECANQARNANGRSQQRIAAIFSQSSQRILDATGLHRVLRWRLGALRLAL